MEFNPSNLARFFTALDVSLQGQYNDTPSWYERVCTTHNCTTEAWLSGWLTAIDKVREWKGPRVIRNPAPMTYMVPIKNWELTEQIDQFKLMDDQWGIYTPIVQEMGRQGRLWPNLAVRDLIQGVAPFTDAQISLDGVNHWSASHPVDYWDSGKGTYCNDFGTAGVSVDGVTVGGSFSVTSYSTLWENGHTRKNESGEVDGVDFDLLMVPPQLKFSAQTVTQSTIFSPATIGVLTGQVGAVDNPYRGSTDMLVNPHISNQPTAFYMLETKGTIKPFGWISRAPFQIVPRIAPTDDNVFNLHAYQYGAWCRGVPAWGPPRKASRSGIV